MSAFPAFKFSAVGLAPCRDIGADVKFSACRGFSTSRNTGQARALLPSAHRRRLEPGRAGSCSAQREATVALEARGSERASLSYRRRARPPGIFMPGTRRLKDNDGQPCWPLGSPGIIQRWREREVVSVPQGVASFAPPRTTPNPSVNRRANGRPPGPRGAVVYPAPRGPGVLPLSPGYLKR